MRAQTPTEATWYRGSADAVRRNLPVILEDYRGALLPDDLLILSGQALYRMVCAHAHAPCISLLFLFSCSFLGTFLPARPVPSCSTHALFAAEFLCPGRPELLALWCVESGLQLSSGVAALH
jgi:hypothetical protein